MKHASKILSAFLFPILVSLAHLIVRDGLHLYVRRPSIDLPFHYIGGFSIVYTASLILSRLESEKMIAPLNKIIFVILLLSLTATTAVVWEFAEFISDQVLRTHLQPSIANTMQDTRGRDVGLHLLLARVRRKKTDIGRLRPVGLQKGLRSSLEKAGRQAPTR